jgi:ABC-type dipeptide/oligopeptide/nickel transport system permease subunit
MSTFPSQTNEAYHQDSRMVNPPRRKKKRISSSMIFSLTGVTLFLILGLFAPLIAPHSPTRQGWGINYLPPAWVNNPIKAGISDYLLGTDGFGRDLLSRLIFGTRTALFLVLMAVPIAGLLGITIGLTSGYMGKWIDDLLMRLTDLVGAFPPILFSVLMVFVLRKRPIGNIVGGSLTLALAFGLINWVGLARLVRGATLLAKQELYVEAALSLGARPLRVLSRHIFPNILGPVLVWLAFAVSKVIILEAILGYLGIGIINASEGNEFIVTSWGGLFYDGRHLLHTNPLALGITCGLVILIASSFTILGDAIRDWIDPRSVRVKILT